MKKTLPMCCISFDSYIKPQQENAVYAEQNSCISFDSYIKPQPCLSSPRCWIVVYLLIPTSNHNSQIRHTNQQLVVYLLIPTSNHNLSLVELRHCMLYIFWFLHQTTTKQHCIAIVNGCISFDSYIKPQPLVYEKPWLHGCISFDSYIKPQLGITAKVFSEGCISFDSYIKPQRSGSEGIWYWSCISFDSYIKPQPLRVVTPCGIVVYLLIPTSNHNTRPVSNRSVCVVYLLIPTSNHNRWVLHC